MEKLRQETINFTESNIDKIASLFPSAITETKDADGNLKRAVNFEQLKQLLSDEVVEGEEHYEFTWVGKKQSIIEGNRPIRKTLRPCVEESKNWDTTENLYIEGDNLEVLKLLQNSYLNKIKMIYIDPPYNTGNDFVYKDNFKIDKEEYEEQLELFDEEENKLFKNTETNGRFHSDWCSMMYPRLALARNLLAEDGVIFISIDDNEVHNLRSICDEVFGESNFVANVIWQKKFSRANDATFFSTMHDNILCYCKKNILFDIKGWEIGLLPRGDEVPAGYSNPDDDPRGLWISVVLSAKSGSNKLLYEILTPSGRVCNPPSGRYWSVNKEKFDELVHDNRIWFGKNGDGIPRLKTFLSEVQAGLRPNTIVFHAEGGHNQEGKQETKELFDGIGVFDSPKPVRLLRLLITIANLKVDDIVLDFFSGSSTTAHATMQLNADDGGNRKFIMVQLPEETDPKSEAYKAGYINICEIGKERIRRAGNKIEEELKTKSKESDLFEENEEKTLDTGFRVLKVDDTNLKDVYYSPSEYNQQMLLDLESNIKEDRTDIDLLYGVMLDWGVPLSLSHITETIEGKKVHYVNDTDLVACFEDNVPEAVIRNIANRKPMRLVFRDSSFQNSPDKINVAEIFKTLSPHTIIKVI